MRTLWFSDNRDLVKWSALLHLARQHKLSVIVQLCFLNPHEFPPLTLDGVTMPIPHEVIKQFRSLHSVETLSDKVEIKVFDHPFTNRTAYLKTALEYANQFAGRPRAVFLDPDTGLSPRKPDFKHVTDAEAGILVCPRTGRCDRALSTPDESTWPSLGEAEAEAVRDRTRHSRIAR